MATGHGYGKTKGSQPHRARNTSADASTGVLMLFFVSILGRSSDLDVEQL